MLYKVGDLVCIIDLVANTNYDGLFCNDDMVKYSGQIFAIKRVRGYAYQLDGAGGWSYNDAMLMPAENPVNINGKDLSEFL